VISKVYYYIIHGYIIQNVVKLDHGLALNLSVDFAKYDI